ncbi:hypothetical protein HZC07_05630 [Candidatus Micrarchaeota archaeon]|nr:hypothetical protein [Candidatus Micrarchaeota archaeon]
MKGQLSLEYLVLSLVAISLLSISIISLFQIKKSVEYYGDLIKFKSSAISLSDTINELCALGTGTGRELKLNGAISIEPNDYRSDDGWVIRFFSPDLNTSLVQKSLCSVDASQINGIVYIKNEDGTIKVRER